MKFQRTSKTYAARILKTCPRRDSSCNQYQLNMKIILVALLFYLATSQGHYHHVERDLEEGDRDTFEGDILLTPEQREAIENAIHEQESGVNKRKATADVVQVWPQGIVPYIIDANAPNHQRIRDAIAHWMEKTCLKILPHTADLSARLGHNNKVKFVRSLSGCSSYIGRQSQWSEQNINLADFCSFGNIVHEIGHAIGFWHEQSRRDRDFFVTVHEENIETGRAGNFEKYDLNDGDDYGVSYDKSSIMHYPSTAFSTGGATITVNNGPDSFIGQRDGLSYYDVKLARLLYGCKERECFVRGDASDYRGIVSTTTSGRTCQRWSDQAPHAHSYTPSDRPESGLGEHNYCRNPNGEEPRPWCYTTDAGKRWEHCDVGTPGDNCNDECYFVGNAGDYRGTVSKTNTGKTCQKWTSQSPHGHDYTPWNRPNQGLGDHNYCRSAGYTAAWCYTTDPSARWEECDVGQPREYCDAECFFLGNANDYRGRVSRTNTGKTCQKWTSQSPHGHDYTPSNRPNQGLGDHNYCRSAGYTAAWCYTTNPSSRWEECDVGQAGKTCGEECFIQDNASDYRGDVTYTENGKKCQKWTSQSPHGHTYTPANYPNDGIGDHNYCRTAGYSTAWCYTTDPNTRWEVCNLGQKNVRCD